jgi:peptidoglycan/xylan/chitin deacetylase (PgdA/CDA1 family)
MSQDIIMFALRLTGISWLLREVYVRRKVTIINYPDPSPEVFARHMAVFSRVYSFISIDQMTRALENNDFSDLPLEPMLVTLDDGHVGNAMLYETIRLYRIPAVIYAVAGVVDTCCRFWFRVLPADRHDRDFIMNQPDAERRSILQRDYDHLDDREYETAEALSAAQLREFIILGGTVGSHTIFHPLLSRCDDEMGRKECRQSRVILEEMLDTPVRHFALPRGDADNRTRAWVLDAGYSTCRTTKPGWVTRISDRFALPDFGVSDAASINKALVQACGLWDGIKIFVRALR